MMISKAAPSAASQPSSLNNSPSVGILRRTPTVIRGRSGPQGHDLSIGSPSSRTPGVHFAAPENLSDLLARYGASEGRDIDRATLEELDGFLTHLRHQKGPALVDLLQKLQQNIAALKPRIENFVLSILRIGWVDQEQPVVTAYCDFLVNLVTAQGYYTKPVVKMLLSNFVGLSDSSCVPQEELDTLESMVFRRTHEVLEAVLKATPWAARSSLLQYSRECQPYILAPSLRSHTNYVANLLQMMNYVLGDEDHVYILSIVLERLVQLDAHIGSELTEDEVDNNMLPPAVAAARNILDASMMTLFHYMKEREALGDLSRLYPVLLRAFDINVFPAHAIGHVQFSMFYLLGKCPKITPRFLEWLWNKQFIRPNVPTIIRQTAICYISSLIARASFVNVTTLMRYLEKIVSWAHAYLENVGSRAAVDNLKVHGPFYAACQAAFYIISFRHEELASSRRNLAFLRSLQLNSIVTCRLNPLRVCIAPLVKHFSAVSRHYQIAYCETIIQKNLRLTLPVVDNTPGASGGISKPIILDSFFPFDPYRLKNSKAFIVDIYREYNGGGVVDKDNDEDGDEFSDEGDDSSDDDNTCHLRSLDDELLEMEERDGLPRKTRTLSSGSMDFVYGTSPGYKS